MDYAEAIETIKAHGGSAFRAGSWWRVVSWDADAGRLMVMDEDAAGDVAVAYRPKPKDVAARDWRIVE